MAVLYKTSIKYIRATNSHKKYMKNIQYKTINKVSKCTVIRKNLKYNVKQQQLS